MLESPFNIDKIKRGIAARGTLLNSGVKYDVEKAVLNSIGINTTKIISDVYRSFDGFPDGVMDGKSGIRIWPLEEILTFSSGGALQSRISFADFLLQSDNITFDISDEGKPVIYAQSNQIIAPSYLAFLSSLAEGKLDFM